MASLYPFISEMFPYRQPSDHPGNVGIELTTFIPKDLTKVFQTHILVNFSTRELLAVAMTCKAWRIMVNSPRTWDRFNLEKMFPLKVIDEPRWDEIVDLDESHLSFKGLGPIDKRLAIPQVVKFFADLRKIGKQVPQGATLLTIPEGASVALVDAIFAFSKEKDHKRLFPEVIARPYRVLITNACLPGTEEWDHDDKRSFVEENEFRLPTFLEARLMVGFSEAPLLSTLCSETLLQRDPSWPDYWKGHIISVTVRHKIEAKPGIGATRVVKC